MYTKKFFQEFVNLWENLSTNELAEKLKIEKKYVSYVACKIRKAGYNLTKKRQEGEFQALITESLDEIGFPRNKEKYKPRTYKLHKEK